MSTDWQIRCVDCDECGCMQENRGFEWVQNVIRCAPALVMLHDLSTERDMCVQHVTGWHAGNVDLDFITKHRGHRLVPHDEYGRDDLQCFERVTCECGASHHCILDEGHEGAHQRGKRS